MAREGLNLARNAGAAQFDELAIGDRLGGSIGCDRAGGSAATAPLRDVYLRLRDAYGTRHWWPGDPFEIIVGAILVQQTAWTNVEKALANLRAAGALSPEGMRPLTEETLADLVRASGFYRGKARKLRAFLDLLYERFDGDLVRMLATPSDELRPTLLATHGIGEETADAILLYAAGQPHFVIDAYTRRMFSRMGVTPERDAYGEWQRLFTDSLPRDVAVYGEYHGLIIEHGKRVCRKEPLCGGCPMLDVCEYGRVRETYAGKSQTATTE